MAKSKTKPKPRRRAKALSTKKSVMTVRKKRRRKKSTALSTHRRRAVHPATTRRRKRKTGMMSDSGSAPNLKQMGFRGTMAFLAGAAYGGGTSYFKIGNPWAKAGIGVVGFMGLTHLKMRDLGAGLLGAMGADVVKPLLSKMLNDGDMHDIQYVDPATLSDSGMCDNHGNPIIVDKQGICYSQDHEGTLHEMGDVYSLSDPTSNMQSVSMLPLQEEYNLSANPYNLASGY